MRFATAISLGLMGSMLVAGSSTNEALAEGPVPLTVFAAGTLAKPFTQMARAFEKQHPGIVLQPQFGGSVKMVKRVTVLKQAADIVAVADYTVIPKYMFQGAGTPGYANWYAGFARNAITFTYTDKSKFAGEINGNNWYEVLARKGVEIGRSNPDTDPSGYQTLQMLVLAQSHYKHPGLETAILANAPAKNIRDTETDLISALQLGQIDYLAIYRSDALQHHFKYIPLPAEINLSDPRLAKSYARAAVHTANGDLTGKPIVYALTIPANAPHPEAAAQFVAFVLGKQGRKILQEDGFETLEQAYAVHSDKMPASLRSLVAPWPAS